MAEWLVEHGIGEHRALLVDGEAVLAAQLHWPGNLGAGQTLEAQLVSKQSGAKRGTARTQAGAEILLDNLPRAVTEGETIAVTITRAPIAERGRLKRAVGKLAKSGLLEDMRAKGVDPANADHLRYPMIGGNTVRFLPTGTYLDSRWEDIWQAASSGSIDFAGGSIIVSTTPAMTVIDIDGEGSPRELSLAAIPAIGQALRWFDIGGNVGIDFPTIEAKSERKAVDAALDSELHDWPHERTAMNGFGFVQLVARLEGPSLLHRFAASRTGLCARMALRRAEMVKGPGATLLSVHPALKAKLKPEWLDELTRRTGRETRIAADPALALEGPQAQIVER